MIDYIADDSLTKEDAEKYVSVMLLYQKDNQQADELRTAFDNYFNDRSDQKAKAKLIELLKQTIEKETPLPK